MDYSLGINFSEKSHLMRLIDENMITSQGDRDIANSVLNELENIENRFFDYTSEGSTNLLDVHKKADEILKKFCEEIEGKSGFFHDFKVDNIYKSFQKEMKHLKKISRENILTDEKGKKHIEENAVILKFSNLNMSKDYGFNDDNVPYEIMEKIVDLEGQKSKLKLEKILEKNNELIENYNKQIEIIDNEIKKTVEESNKGKHNHLDMSDF